MEYSEWDQSWRPEHAGLLWINPQFNMILLVVDKQRRDSAWAIVIVPQWKSKSWWALLQSITQRRWKLSRRHGIFWRGGTKHMKATLWDVWALLVDGGLANVLVEGEVEGENLNVVAGINVESVHW